MIIKNNKKFTKNERIVFILSSIISVSYLYTMVRYLKMGTPYYLHPDEPIVTSRVLSMFSNNTLELSYFKYPGLSFYYGLICLKIISKLFENVGSAYVIRLIYTGTALVSNIFIYFTLNKLFKNRIISCIGFTLALTSLYISQWLYYAGPDVLLYAFGNIVAYLVISLTLSDDDNKNLYLYYPLFAIAIGLATAVKYHGILLYILLLYVHIAKKYYKSYKFNYLLLLTTVPIPLIFVACNPYMFADFKKFMDHILFNFAHYSGSHTGLDDPMPVITYVDVFFRYSFGVPGVAFTLLGLAYFIKRREYKILFALLSLPVLTIFILGRYALSLPRNIAFCLPFSYVLCAAGFAATEQWIKAHGKKICKANRYGYTIPILILIFMTVPHILILNHISGFKDSRDAARDYIAENIPEGSTIYIPHVTDIKDGNGDYYMPGINYDKYNITTDRGDLTTGDYAVDSSAIWQRYYQTNHFLLGGKSLYPEQLKNQQEAVQNYEPLASFLSFYSIYEQRFTKSEVYDLRVLGFDNDDYYFGPSVDIYRCKRDLRHDYSSVVLSTENIPAQAEVNSDLKITVKIDNQSSVKLLQNSGNGVHSAMIYYRITDSNGNVCLENRDSLIPINEAIPPNSSGSVELAIPLCDLDHSRQYALEIDIEKKDLYMLSEAGMQKLTVPISIIP